MARREEAEEVDYLAGTQLAVDPSSFVRRVKEAFYLEHDCVESQDIAAVLGVDKSRVSQIFRHPSQLKADTIRNILDKIKSERYRRWIVEAWVKECFAMDLSRRPRPSVNPAKIGPNTLRRVDRYVREQRLADARYLAVIAAAQTNDPVLREQFRDRAFLAAIRLDRMGHAVATAREIAEDAQSSGNLRRLATAHLLRARALIGLTDCRPDEVEPIFDVVRGLLLASPPAVPMPYKQVCEYELRALIRGALISFVDRGTITVTEAELEAMFGEILSDLKKVKAQGQRFNLHLLAARVSLKLGKTFLAQEHVDQAFGSGKLANLHSVDMCALVQARILQVIEPPERVRDRLRTMISNAEKSQDFYHRRMAEADLARLESNMFPPSPPCL